MRYLGATPRRTKAHGGIDRMTNPTKDELTRTFNRELSWLQFNHRVQTEADNPQNPLLERAKFLAIVTSNLDEYMQVRYHGALQKARQKPEKRVPGGMTAKGLYKTLNKEILHQQNLQYLLFEGIRSELYLRGVRLNPTFSLTEPMKQFVNDLFTDKLAVQLVPNISFEEGYDLLPQKVLHMLVKLTGVSHGETRYALLRLPTTLPRLYQLPSDDGVTYLMRLESVVKQGLWQLFPGYHLECAHAFRVLRNQDFPVDEQAEDIPAAVRDMLAQRKTGEVMRLEVEERMPAEMLLHLMDCLHVTGEQLYRVTGPLDLNKLMMKLYGLVDAPELKYAPAPPRPIPELMGDDVLERIAAKDYLLYHPYHSFEPVIHLMRAAAVDPDVRSIKQTLYRVSESSPIVEALAQAAENGKQVTVLFEAHARFDEENNLFLGERLQRAGCRVIFGVKSLKTHSKITLVTRRKDGVVTRFLHLGTGNYHDGTAKLYTDMGLLTADPTLCEDAVSFFGTIEGYGETPPMREMVMAPETLKSTLCQLIDREREHALEGRRSGIIAKMNSLVDETVIAALYDASRAGVPVRLIVRGVCCLRPGVPGLSETIAVRSIVGRHLEHARAFRFENDGQPQVFLSSADWMPRNLQRRVELMFPVKQPELAEEVSNVLRLQLADTDKAWELQADGSYLRAGVGASAHINAQEELLAHLDEALDGALLRTLQNAGKAEQTSP